MQIRQVGSADAEITYQIRNAAIRAQCAGFYAPDLIDAWTAGHHADWFAGKYTEHFYVLEVAGQAVATGMLHLDKGQLDAIFVRPEHMQQGLGKTMVAFLERLAQQHGLKQLCLESTLNAAAFYRTCGFVGDEVSQYHSPRGFSLDCVRMVKVI